MKSSFSPTYLFVFLQLQQVAQASAGEKLCRELSAEHNVKDEVALLQTKLALVQRHSTNATMKPCFGDDCEIRTLCLQIAPSNDCSKIADDQKAGGKCHQSFYYNHFGQKLRCYNAFRESSECIPSSRFKGDLEPCPNKYLDTNTITRQHEYVEVPSVEEVPRLEIRYDPGGFTRIPNGALPDIIGPLNVFPGWEAGDVFKSQIKTFHPDMTDDQAEQYWNSLDVKRVGIPASPGHKVFNDPSSRMLLGSLGSADFSLELGVIATQCGCSPQGPWRTLRNTYGNLATELVTTLYRELWMNRSPGWNAADASYQLLAGKLANAEQTLADLEAEGVDGFDQLQVADLNFNMQVTRVMTLDFDACPDDFDDESKNFWFNYRWNQWADVCGGPCAI